VTLTRPFALLAVALTAQVLSVSPCLAQSDVDLELLQFGVGSACRAGDVVAIRVKVTSHMEEGVQAWVQWEVPNADGDIAEHGRMVALTPNVPSEVWLYAYLPRIGGEYWPVRVFEVDDDGDRMRELGGARISPRGGGAQSIEIDFMDGMIGVLGPGMTLDHYQAGVQYAGEPPRGSIEDTRIIFGIKPEELPDRWEGMRGLEALVWSADPAVRPGDLKLDSAEAVAQWVQRGGHLVICLQGAADPWGLGLGGRTELDRLLPQQTPRRDEVPLSQILPIISKSGRLPRERDIAVRVFKELGGSFDVIDNHYEPLIALPDGRVCVVQRTYGHGRVTVIGLELSRTLESMDLPHADVFWARILGRRADTPRPDEIKALEDQKLMTDFKRSEVTIGSGTMFQDMIKLSGQATLGLFVAVLLFGAYWALAGPLGFLALRHLKMVRHAWVAFALAAMVFTGIAWASVGIMRNNDTTIRHVTILDQIARPEGDRGSADPQYARGTSFFSLALPGYGRRRVSLRSESGQRDLLYSWTPPGEISQKFPNVDRYLIDLRSGQADYDVPTRATSSQFYAHWLGPLDPAWGGMFLATQPISVERDVGGGPPRLSGSIRHTFPVPLTNVKIILVTADREQPKAFAPDRPWLPLRVSGRMLNTGRMWAFDQLAANTPFDLVSLSTQRLSDSLLDSNITRTYIDPYEGTLLSVEPVNDTQRRERIEMLSMFHALTPPEYIRGNADQSDKESVVINRRAGRELDLSTWFSRPCLIIIGSLHDSPTPLPVLVDGEPVALDSQSESVTIVRWIYPLPLDETQLADVVNEEDRGERPR
jgi:hypothetical protein